MDKQNAVHYTMEYCRCLVAKSSSILLQPLGLWPARLFCPWDFPGKNTGVGCHFLLQGTFPTQGLNPCLLQMAGRFFTAEPPGKPTMEYYSTLKRSEAHALRWINLKIIMLSKKQNRCKSDKLHVSIYMKYPE